MDIVKYILDLIQNNIILSVATLIGTIVGIGGWLESKKSKKELKNYEYLFRIAANNIDRDLTKEQLEQLHKEKNEMQQKVMGLNKIIKEDIPFEARRTVLFDRLKEDEKYLIESFTKYKNTKSEYEKIEQIENNIPEEILTEIELHIMPDYLSEQRKQRYMSMFTYISVGSAILSVLPLTRVLGNFVILWSLYPLIRICALNLPKNKKERRKYITNILYYVVLSVIGIYNAILLLHVIFEYYIDDIFMLISTITLPLFVIMLLFRIIPKLIQILLRKKQ
ncbi:MAG: hypothetical protein IJE10_10135 [Clostridia bacterium]|nr:hypothetical protein [Clostridia bacterium]